MHTQSNKQLKTFSGQFQEIKLDFTPEPPLTLEERYQHKQNYPTTLAYLHIYLNSEDAAKLIPSTYMMLLLDHLLSGVANLVSGQAETVRAEWWSEAWYFILRGDIAHNRVSIDLEMPSGKWVAMRNVSVPLDQFGHSVIRLAQKWEKYLLTQYHDEMVDEDWGEDYRLFQSHLKRAKQALENYR